MTHSDIKHMPETCLQKLKSPVKESNLAKKKTSFTKTKITIKQYFNNFFSAHMFKKIKLYT